MKTDKRNTAQQRRRRSSKKQRTNGKEIRIRCSDTFIGPFVFVSCIIIIFPLKCVSLVVVVSFLLFFSLYFSFCSVFSWHFIFVYFVFGGRRNMYCVRFDVLICWLLLHMASFFSSMCVYNVRDWMIVMRVPKGTEKSRIKNHTFYVHLSFIFFIFLIFISSSVFPFLLFCVRLRVLLLFPLNFCSFFLG